MQRILESEAMDTPVEAAEYDSMNHAGPNDRFVTRLIELHARGVMLDIGTGPGHIPLLVVERIPACRVLGVDLSRHMLAHAERHRAASPHNARLRFELADGKTLRYADGKFDTVFSNTILHHIPDPRPFLREARRVLRPTGTLLIRDLIRPETALQADAWTATNAAGATLKQQALLRASYGAAFTLPELRALADESGLSQAQLVQDDETHMSLQIHAA